LANSVLDRRDELLRNGAADNLVLEGDVLRKVFTVGFRLLRRVRLDVDRAVAELTTAARLLLEEAADIVGRTRDRLAVRDTRLTNLHADLHVAHELVLDDLQVKLAHPRDDRLARLFVVVRAEGRVLAA